MKFIKTYESYRYQVLLEGENKTISIGRPSIDDYMNKAFKPSVMKLENDVKLDDVLEYCKVSLLNSKSPDFLYKPILDELNSPGSQEWNLPDSTADRYFEDAIYYKFAKNFLAKSGYLMGENLEKLPTNGKVEMSKICDAKFGENKMPFEVIRYCMEKVRDVVSKEYKYVDENLAQVFVQSKTEGKENTPTGEGVPNNFYIDDKPSQVFPDLKKTLIECGGRDVDTSKGLTPELMTKLKPIADKKRKAFLVWLEKLFFRFTETVKKITPEEVKAVLEKKGIKPGSSYSKGNEVIYLKKDKTIDDWKKLSEEDKSNLDSDVTKEIVAKGTITSIEGDNVEIEYVEGKKAIKTVSEIIKKV